MRHFLLLLVFVISGSLVMPACAGRSPSVKSAHSMTSHFFKSYGKKYKNSFLGKNKLTRVEVNQVQEQARNLAAVDAFLSLDDGQSARVFLMVKNTPPFGWRVISWELLDIR